MRLAWFTPWPPDRHPAARRSRDVVRALAAGGDEIDLIVPDEAADTAPPSTVSIVRASEASARLARREPDLCAYHVANSPAAAFIWPHLRAQPGLAVLHDVHLYEARARAAGEPAAGDDSRGQRTAAAAAFLAEFAFAHPDVSPDAAELAIAGFSGAYSALWPMTRLVVARSRAVAAPTPADAQALLAASPFATIVTIGAGIAAPPPGREHARRVWRSRSEVPQDAVVFALMLGPDDDAGRRRVPQILRAFASTVGRVPSACLLIAGEPVTNVPVDLQRGLVRTGPVTEADLWHVMDGVDVLLDLHWPPTGGPGDDRLAASAAGRPAIFMDSVGAAGLAALDPRSWLPPGDGRPPVGVAIDVVDENHSLRLAMYRLAIDADLRARLGGAAHALWQESQTNERMVRDTTRAIERAVQAPDHVGPATGGVG